MMNNIFNFTTDTPNQTDTNEIVNIDNIINDLRLIEIDFPKKTIIFTRVSENEELSLHRIDINRTDNQINIFIGTNNKRFAFIHISNINEPFVGFIMNNPKTNNFEDSIIEDKLIRRLNVNTNLPNYFLCNSYSALNLNHLRDLNNFYIRQCINLSNRVLCTWGEKGTRPIILNNIRAKNLYQYIYLTNNNNPRYIFRLGTEVINLILKELTRTNNITNNEYINNIHND